MGQEWSYDIGVTAKPELTLTVRGVFAPSSDWLNVDDDAAPYVRDVEYDTPDGWRATRKEGLAWALPCRSGCTVRYRFDLAAAAAAINDADTALAAGGIIVAPPSTWLLRPSGPPPEGRYRFRVRTEAGTSFATGVRPARDGTPGAFEAAAADLFAASYAVFGPFRTESIAIGAARVDVVPAPVGLPLSTDGVVSWVRTAVAGIADYYGRFPVDRTLVIVIPGKQEPTRGKTLGGGGAAVLIRTGTALNESTVVDDWVVTHELLHVTLPSVSPDNAWLGEGIATYVEPIVRARAGLITASRFWRDLIVGLPEGLPAAGDEGLNKTHTWGRTYWGGALFCLVVDVRTREVSGQTRSLDDALRAIVATGDDVERVWDAERIIREGDRATGTTEMAKAYREMALSPGTVDLAALWARLGVRLAAGDEVVFDPNAPLRAIREAIVSRSKP